MKCYSLSTKITILLLTFSVLLSSCSSTTLIQSFPAGAKLYVDGESVGTTPYTHRDTKIVGSTTTIRLEKEGYQPLTTTFSRDEEVDVGAIIGGLFVWIPFLWTMKYKPVHSYELIAIANNAAKMNDKVPTGTIETTKSKADRLREYKQLLDEGIINQEEFEREKEKILSEDE